MINHSEARVLPEHFSQPIQGMPTISMDRTIPVEYIHQTDANQTFSQSFNYRHNEFHKGKAIPFDVNLFNARINQSLRPMQQTSKNQMPMEPQSQLFLDKLKKKKYLVIGVSLISLGVLIMFIISCVLFIPPKRKVKETPVYVYRFKCSHNPSECDGVPTAVNNYIFDNYQQADEVRSLLQTSRSMSLLPSSNSSGTVTRQNLTDIFKNITKSIECLSFNMPNDYSEAFQKLTELQFTTQSQIQIFLNMTESFSGLPLKLSNYGSVAQNCKFNLTNSTRRRLQEMSPVSAANCSSNVSSVLIYFNGIGYSPSSAVENIRKMQQILSSNSSTNFDGGIIAIGAMRKDRMLGFFVNLAVAYEQALRRVGQTVPSRVDLYSALKMIINLCRSSTYLPRAITRDAYRQIAKFFMIRSIESFINEESSYELTRHRDFVLQQVNEGKKVVLVAHAEGTLYANKVYNMLTSTQKQSVTLVYIAPVVSSMADGTTNYITNPMDYLIESIRGYTSSNVYLSPLSANMFPRNFSSEVDFGMNHELPGYASTFKQILTQKIVSAKSRAVQPYQAWGSGPITVTLTWDSQPDVDLHIFQPDGTHVYYASKTGRNGYLDVDDITAYGPEHYYTNCTLETGIYTIKLNYYSGYSTTSTIVTVAAGTEYFMKSLSLFYPTGSYGDYNPSYFVCNVTVSRGYSTGEYQFAIVG